MTGLLTLAVEAGDAERTEAVLARVDEASVQSPTIERLRAWYYVSAGAGASGVGPLRRALESLTRDRELVLALGHLYLQAGLYQEALSHFASIVVRDSSDVEGVVGRSLAQVHMNRITVAGRALDDIEDATATLSPEKRALYHAAKARVLLAQGRTPQARRQARSALALDSRCSEARLVLADMADEAEQDPSRHLRAALTGRSPPPDALARLALAQSEEPTENSCTMGRRYLEVAPRGPHAAGVRRMVRRACS